jgi:hypothetical protein
VWRGGALFGLNAGVIGSPTVGMEFTRRPTYAVVQQSGPARNGDRVINWLSVCASTAKARLA